MMEISVTKRFATIVNSMQIAPHLPEIVRLISSHPTVSIVAPTGSGKSLGIPGAISAVGAKCFVVVPTRTGAISLAEYQRVLQRAADPTADVNKLVGYAAEGNINYGPETKIVYVTGGHMRRKLLSYFSGGNVAPIDFCDVILVDEVHSGSLDTTLIISLWMTAAAARVHVPRLVVASATPVPMIIQPEPVVYTVDLAAYPIEYRYLTKEVDIDDPSGILYTETANLTANIHRNTGIDTGHILVFAAGSAEVESIASSLEALLKTPIPGKKVNIIPAFGALKQDDIAMIYKQTAPDERKIVIATNIAEMSITIENVGHVVDTMVEKRAETSQSGGFRLTTHYISKDSAKQRAGRTGRTRPGVCYRMCTQERYEKLEEHRPPEIERVPIYEMVMELLDVGLSPEVVLRGVDSQRISNAIYLLTRLGMVTSTNAGITVTDSGHFAPNFPLSVRNAALLWQWIQTGYPVFPGVVAASLIDCYGPSYFWVPRRQSGQSIEEYNITVKEYKQKTFAKYIGYNDLETSLNMWNDLAATIGGIRGSQKVLSTWSRNNSINNKKIRELLLIVEQSVKSANRLGYEVQVGPFTTQGVMTAARPLLLSVYSDMTLIQRRDSTYFSPLTKEDYRLDNRDAVNQLAVKPPPGIIALVTAEIKTQRGTFRVVGFGVDTDKDGLGRPIVVRTRATTPRAAGGPRTITRGKQTPVTIPTIANQTTDQNLTDALDLLATLNLGTNTTIETPTDISENSNDIMGALELLNTLDLEISTQTPTVPTYTHNPPLVIEQIESDGKVFNLIQDSHLPVGTKQRGLNYFLELKKVGYTDVVTYATPFGYGQVAVSWCCQIAQLTCYLFLPKVNPRTPMTEMAIQLGANVYEVGVDNEYIKNSVIGQVAREFAQNIQTSMFIELGLDDPIYIQYLAAAIQEAAQGLDPKVIWVAGGSAVIARALAMAFPGVHLNIVQVGRKIYPEVLQGIDHTIYVAQESFPTDTSIIPPYQSLANYDAKVWQFASEYGNTGDYIWNVK